MTEWNFHEADGADGVANGSTIWRDPQNKAAWEEILDTVLRTAHRSVEANWSAYVCSWARAIILFLAMTLMARCSNSCPVILVSWHHDAFNAPDIGDY